MRGEVVEEEEPSFFETLQFSGVLKYKVVVVVVALHGDAEVGEAMVERREEKRRKLLT